MAPSSAVHRTTRCFGDKTVPPLDQFHVRIQKRDMGYFWNLRGTRLLVIALYALVSASVGFAHKTTPNAQVPDDLAAFVHPDGTIAVICGDVGNQDADYGSRHTSPVCDACRLVAAPGIVSASECWTLVRRPLSSLSSRVSSDRVDFRKSSHVPHLRGPPEIG